MKIPGLLRTIIVLCSMAVGLLAVFGGLMLSLQPSGATLTLDPALLEPTPFEDYLIPGIILLVVIGFYGWVVVAMTWLQKPKYPLAVVIYGVLLTGWLTVELILNPAFFWPGMHVSLYSTSAFLIAAGLYLQVRKP